MCNTNTSKILPSEDWPKLAERAAQHSAKRDSIVLTSGTFDILHVGHLRYLMLAKSYGDILIVAVNSDEYVRAKKGFDRPIIPQNERAELIAGLACVDIVIVVSDVRQTLLRHVRPSIRVYSETTGLSESKRFARRP